MNKNRKALSILMRARMRPLSPTTNRINQMQFPPIDGVRNGKVSTSQEASATLHTDFLRVQQSMHAAMSMNKTEILDVALDDFSEGYYGLPNENRRALLLTLAREYDLNRKQVRDLMKQYLGLELPSSDKLLENAHEGEGSFSAFYRIERNLRESLKPMEENTAVLRALDSYLKEKLITWLSPANLQLHHITWDDSASLLEKIVAHEAVHPISNLLDLKRRLGEPLIFIEVALMKHVAQTIQEVLWDDPPIPECEATCALFYSISSTQPGLSGINLGKFLIKRVIDVVRRDMPTISTFATLSPIPGYMQWILSKLAPTEISDSTFSENLLTPEEESALLEATEELTMGKNGMEVLRNLLSSSEKWINSEKLASLLRIPLMRLCARYLLQEKKRGKALDSVGNFHLQNGAMVGRINWMADLSEKGLKQSAGIMVNYIYEVDHIEENAQSYFGDGEIGASDEVRSYLKVNSIFLSALLLTCFTPKPNVRRDAILPSRPTTSGKVRISPTLPISSTKNSQTFSGTTRMYRAPTGPGPGSTCPFTCDCLNGDFLGHTFAYITQKDDTYSRVAKFVFANLTTDYWIQRVNVYDPTQVPDSVPINVTVNCSCGDPKVIRVYGLFATYPLLPGETLMSLAADTGVPPELLKEFNPVSNFEAGSGTVFLPAKG
ncbi:hypothetical protein SASPL_117030 [Salvia splendens]|uniref:Malonyl-CoA decarboxylase n=1 Tax=Salvia splendens TaxID=180675 RepID=A0A8X8XWT4_SALSN|nr:hypothetical protein SASPL_117030 [Salvia splendens]